MTGIVLRTGVETAFTVTEKDKRLRVIGHGEVRMGIIIKVGGEQIERRSQDQKFGGEDERDVITSPGHWDRGCDEKRKAEKNGQRDAIWSVHGKEKWRSRDWKRQITEKLRFCNSCEFKPSPIIKRMPFFVPVFSNH